MIGKWPLEDRHEKITDLQRTVAIRRDDLLRLIDHAESDIIEADTEYSSPPNDEDRVFMLRMWKLAGKAMPDWFGRFYGWKQE